MVNSWCWNYRPVLAGQRPWWVSSYCGAAGSACCYSRHYCCCSESHQTPVLRPWCFIYTREKVRTRRCEEDLQVNYNKLVLFREREWVYILGIVVSLVVVESRERGSFLLYHTKREGEREREECLTGRRITLSYLLLAWSHTHTGMMTLLELHNGLQYIVHSRTPSALNSSESSGRRKRECIATCSYANFLQKSCRLPKRRATPMC